MKLRSKRITAALLMFAVLLSALPAVPAVAADTPPAAQQETGAGVPQEDGTAVETPPEPDAPSGEETPDAQTPPEEEILPAADEPAQTQGAGIAALTDVTNMDGVIAALRLLGDSAQAQALLRRALEYYYTNYDADAVARLTASLRGECAAIAQRFAAAFAERSEGDGGYRKGNVLIGIDTARLREVLDDIAQRLGCEELRATQLDDLTVVTLSLPLEFTVDYAIQLLEALPLVRFAQPVLAYAVQAQPEAQPFDPSAQPQAAAPQMATGDPYASYMWHLDKIGVKSAWDFLRDNTHSRVRVAVLDTGCDIAHLDLQAALNKPLSVNVVGVTSGAYPLLTSDPHGHGTHVCGIIAATSGNGVGVAGVASGYNNDIVDLVAVDVFDGDGAYDDDVIAAIEYAVEKGCRVINMSLGAQSSGTDYWDIALKNAVDYADAANTVVVCSAGNENTDALTYPSDIESAVSVVALDSDDVRCDFSNYGGAKDISAPGESILSTYPGDYCYMSGTSQAAPIVAAVAAMILSLDSDMTSQEVKDQLYLSSVAVSGVSGSAPAVMIGHGRVSAADAISATPHKLLLASPSDTLLAGSPLQLSLTAWPSFSSLGSRTITWSTSNDYASVGAGGLLQTYKYATTTQTVRATATCAALTFRGQALSASCDVQVPPFVISASVANNRTLAVGGTRQLGISYVLSGTGSTSRFYGTWRLLTGDATCVLLTQNGEVTALAPGSVQVQATVRSADLIDGKTYLTPVVTLRVTDKIVTAVTVSGALRAQGGSAVQYTADVRPTDADDTGVVWSVANGTGAATIDADGRLTGTRAGTVTVRATAADGSGVYGELKVTVYMPVSVITVGSDEDNLLVGKKLQMSAAVEPQDASDRTVVWSISSGADKATITDKGLLTGTADGYVTVRATAADGSGVYGEKTVAVQLPVSSIVITVPKTVLAVDATMQLTATALPETAGTRELEWMPTSNVDGILTSGGAHIDQNGLIKGFSPGVITILVRACDGSGVFEKTQITITAFDGAGTQADPYLVRGRRSLNYVRYSPDAYYKMTQDVAIIADEFSGPEHWTPIETFGGTFDGDGHAITDLSIESTDKTDADTDRYFGFVGYNTGTIKNLTVSGAITAYARQGSIHAGGIAACNAGGTISGCENNCSVAATVAYGSVYVGGIAGESTGAVTDCTNAVAMTATGAQSVRCGGIVGENALANAAVSGCDNSGAVSGAVYAVASGNSENCNGAVGGIVGANVSAASVNDVENTGAVLADAAWSRGVLFLGGIAGDVNQSAVTDAVNRGAVGVVRSRTTDTEGLRVGGVAGQVSGGTLTRANNYGAVELTTALRGTPVFNDVGGIAGSLHISTVTDCDNFGDVDASVTGSTGTWFNLCAGGIAGWVSSQSDAAELIAACDNAADVTADGGAYYTIAYAGGIAGLQTDDAQDVFARSCTNTGDILALSDYDAAYAGGIAAQASGGIDSCSNTGDAEAQGEYAWSGGIVGHAWGAAVGGCSNAGRVTARSLGCRALAGGIAGQALPGEILDENRDVIGRIPVTVARCCNTGLIYAEAMGDANDTEFQTPDDYNGLFPTAAGGIAGRITGASSGIANSFNTGVVFISDHARAAAGGITADCSAGATVAACYHAGYAGRFDRQAGAYAGGIAAYTDSENSLRDCHYGGNCAAGGLYYADVAAVRDKRGSPVAGAARHTYEEMKSFSTFTGFDAALWTMDGDAGFLLPELIGMPPASSYYGFIQSAAVRAQDSLLTGDRAAVTTEFLPQGALQMYLLFLEPGTTGAELISQGSDVYLTAREAGSCTVWALAADGSGAFGEKTVTVIKKVASTGVSVRPGTLTLLADGPERTEGETATVTAVLTPSNSTDTVTYTSFDEAVATVDASTGLVTAEGPGTVKIRATAQSGRYAECTVKVYTVSPALNALRLRTDVDAAGAVTADTLPRIGLQCGDAVKLTAEAWNRTDGALLNVFDGDAAGYGLAFTSSNPNLATVDADGLVRANSTGLTGTVRITAALAGDPSGRRGYKDVRIIPRQADSVRVETLEEGAALATTQIDNDTQTIYIDKADAQGVAGGYRLRLAASLYDAGGAPLTGATVRWASSDTSLGTAAADRLTGDAVVTVRGTKAGAFTVTATSNDLAKTTSEVTIHVRDYTPRADVGSVTLNPWTEAGADVELAPSYGNAVTGVELRVPVTVNRVTTYELSQDMAIERVLDAEGNETDLWTINNADASGNATQIRNQTIRARLYVSTENGETYELPLSVAIRNAQPSITVRQAARFNLFYTDSTAAVSVTAKNGRDAVDVTGVTYTSATPTFASSFDADADVLTLRYTDARDAANFDAYGRPVTRGTLSIALAGYNWPVEKAFTVSTTTARPSCALSASSGAVNTAVGNNRTLSFTLYDKTSRQDVALTGEPTLVRTSPAGFAELGTNGDVMALTLCDVGTAGAVSYVSGTATVGIQQDNWLTPLTYSYRVNVQTGLPSARVGGTLKLSSVFSGTDDYAQTAVTLSQTSVSLMDTRQELVTATTAAAQALDVIYENGVICASFKTGYDPAQLRNGTYRYTYTPYADDGTATGLALRPITVNVNVTNATPGVRLTGRLEVNAASFNAAQSAAGNPAATAAVTVTNSRDALVTAAGGGAQSALLSGDTLMLATSETNAARKAEAEKLTVWYANGTVTAELCDGTAKTGSYRFALPLRWTDGAAAREKGVLTVMVTVVNKAPSSRLSASTVKLNRNLTGELAKVDVTSLNSWFEISGARITQVGTSASDVRVLWDETDSCIKIYEGTGGLAARNETLTYTVEPAYTETTTNRTVEPGATRLTLRVQVYAGNASAAVSAKGKLDVLNRENTGIVYTLSRLNNAVGTVTDVRLTGQDADKFELTALTPDAKGNPRAQLTLKANESYATNVTYRIALAYTLDGVTEKILTPVLNVRVTQSGARAAVKYARQVVYQSNTVRVSRNEISLTAPAGFGEIGNVSVNAGTSAQLKAALGTVRFTAATDANGLERSGAVTYGIARPGRLRAGARYTLVLDVTPKDAATNVRPVQVRVSVTVKA